MAFLIDEAFLPATLTASPMTDDEFAEFCAAHPDLSFEMTSRNDLIVMPPNYTLTGVRNRIIIARLDAWAEVDGRGTTGDSSTGFVLPDGSRLSPDAWWIDLRKVASLDPAEVQRYWHLCPDFVVELKSHWDRLPTLREKMGTWIANGAELAWLIDAEARTVEIYRSGQAPEVRKDIGFIDGEGPFAGFHLPLESIWNPLPGKDVQSPVTRKH